MNLHVRPIRVVVCACVYIRSIVFIYSLQSFYILLFYSWTRHEPQKNCSIDKSRQKIHRAQSDVWALGNCLVSNFNQTVGF